MPFSRQACPKVAACWSPPIPAMGIRAPSSPSAVWPYTSEELRTSGSTLRGTFRIESSSSSHSPVWMLYSRVRLAFVASVMCSSPPVRLYTSQESMVPKASSPFSARSRAPSTLSSSHRTFVPLKYASSTSPVFCWKVASCCARISSQ